MRPLLVVLAFALSACSGADPTSPEECAGISAANERDDCYIKVLPAVFRKDAAAGTKLVEEQISDATARDFAWYEVTKTVDPNTNEYCDRIKDRTLAERCRQVVSRPHLHRNLTGQDAAPGAPGGAPQPAPTIVDHDDPRSAPQR